MNYSLPTKHLTLAALIALLFTVIWPMVAAAHPLGNFTINRYSRLEVETAQINLHYVVDIAEIPAVTELQRLDQNGDYDITPAEEDAYISGMVFALLQGLRLEIDRQSVSFVPQQAALELVPGQGDLLTVRLMIDYTAAFSETDATREVVYRDENYADRQLGWQEIIVQSRDGVTLLESSVPREDVSQELRNYPEALLQEPLQVDVATFRFTLASLEATTSNATPIADAELGPPSPPQSTTSEGSENSFNKPSDPFADLMTVPVDSPTAVIFILLASFGWGAAHALSPGHGKTVVAAYLIGSRGTVGHALFLGLTTTITHTAGVFAMGIVTLLIAEFFLPEQLYPWLGVMSGGLVVVVGFSLLSERWRQFRHTADSHTHHHHDHHHHHHDHHHHHGHSHLPPGSDGTPVTWRSLLALGVSGGLLPCPSALVLMLSAIALGRIGFGLLLIFIFSLGLASVLTLIGLLFVYAGHLFNRFPNASPLVQMMPILSAFVVTLLGLGITIQALMQTGTIFIP